MSNITRTIYFTGKLHILTQLLTFSPYIVTATLLSSTLITTKVPYQTRFISTPFIELMALSPQISPATLHNPLYTFRDTFAPTTPLNRGPTETTTESQPPPTADRTPNHWTTTGPMSSAAANNAPMLWFSATPATPSPLQYSTIARPKIKEHTRRLKNPPPQPPSTQPVKKTREQWPPPSRWGCKKETVFTFRHSTIHVCVSMGVQHVQGVGQKFSAYFPVVRDPSPPPPADMWTFWVHDLHGH